MSKQITDKASARKRGIKELLAGVALAAVGGIATAASYNSARPGETYTVYTGVIALGVVYACIGLWHVASPKVAKKEQQEATKETEAIEASTVKEEED